MAVDGIGKDRIERLRQTLTRCLAIRRRILKAIGNPNVMDAGTCLRPPHRRGDLATGDAVVDPKLSNRGIRVCKSKAIGSLGMCEIGGIKIEGNLLLPPPIDPAREVGLVDLISVDRAVKLAVRGMEVQAMLTGY